MLTSRFGLVGRMCVVIVVTLRDLLLIERRVAVFVVDGIRRGTDTLNGLFGVRIAIRQGRSMYKALGQVHQHRPHAVDD